MPFKQKRLGDAELEIMQIIWTTEEPVSASWIHERLLASRSWPLPSVMTSLTRLVEKGYVRCDKAGRSNLYSALISEAAYRQTEGSSFLSRVFGNSLPNFVASLYDAHALTQEDIDELRAYLDELEAKSRDD
ncbi:MAG: BlaI/MecI/CopY family transcriptional regulator [Ruminococcaceae bacterium]|nr:BlaI/MecI/CopY family transcriptional regulator [Oscillospiraceae bacterium]